MIEQLDTSTKTAAQLADEPITRAAYKVRVLNAASGATIAFDSSGNHQFKLLGYVVYGPFKRPVPVWITGVVLVEWTTDPDEDFDASAAGVTTISAFAGVDAPGFAPTANPVLVAGKDTPTGLVRPIQTDISGRPFVRLLNTSGQEAAGTPGAAAPAGAMQVSGSDGTNLRVPRMSVNGDTDGSRALMGQKHYASGLEKGWRASAQCAGATVGATANFLAILAGASQQLYIRRVRLTSIGKATAAFAALLQLNRITAFTATALIPSQMVAHAPLGASTFSGTVGVNPTATTDVAGGGNLATPRLVQIPTAEINLSSGEIVWDFEDDPMRCIVGTGIVFRMANLALQAGQTGFGLDIEFFERSY